MSESSMTIAGGTIHGTTEAITKVCDIIRADREIKENIQGLLDTYEFPAGVYNILKDCLELSGQ